MANNNQKKPEEQENKEMNSMVEEAKKNKPMAEPTENPEKKGWWASKTPTMKGIIVGVGTLLLTGLGVLGTIVIKGLTGGDSDDASESESPKDE